MTDIFNILIKKKNNCATEEELKKLEGWKKEDERHKVVETQFLNVWKLEESDVDATKDNVWERVAAHIDKEEAVENDSFFNIYRRFLQKDWRRTAAVVSFLLISFSVLFYFSTKDTPQLYTAEIRYNEYVTKAGENKKIILADNSEITLRAGSSIKVPTTDVFNKDRKVMLNGQALFKVSSDETHPFVVVSPHFESKVTGTSFNIIDFDEDEMHEVVLLEGSINVNLVDNKGKGLDLTAGERLVFKSQSKQLVKRELGNSIADWLSNNLVFEGDDFNTVIKKLQRYYDIKIKVQSRNINKKLSFNGVFYEDDTIEDVLEIVSKQFEFTYKTLTNGTIIIK